MNIAHDGKLQCGLSIVLRPFSKTRLLLQELIFSALAEGGPSPNTSAEPLKRLVVEVFSRDLDHFR